MPKTVVIFSGGLDSTTLLHYLRAEGHELLALSVNYGQRHLSKESAAAEAICRKLGIERQIVDLTALVACFGQNALTDMATAVPEGAYCESTIPVTTVPNRNMVMLSVGLAMAASRGFNAVAFGAHGGEHTNYPDCKPGFAAAMDRAAQECNNPPLRVLAPFVTWDKAGIIRRGAELNVPFELTWSCYTGGEVHCGACGTCVDRRQGFIKALVNDPTEYRHP
ncbi:7-cyano-7-deazaguanine synthase QueC [Gemmata sp. JC717]|uniref:7-cyano-7-deazaguanine synthase QueC n=1 Tax=Gemmata algarum TaxID=2975278 RepID=UPI0021BB37FF|nr:7-cyano-7-deazaguanine synthase QueC [Gemmata algarum]MDY3551365.1 7-cyano-7-deazaguanine synthase QueC [Gemmata algarum]